MTPTPTLEPPPALAAQPPAAAAGAPTRIDWLFRDALRQRQIHPLMELLRRYRQQDAS